MDRPDYTLPLDQLPDPLPIEPLTRPFDVTITPPGSKSITCRAYVLAALAKGESKLIRPLRADDTDLLLKALCTLGAEARWDGEDVYIKGVGGRFPRGGSVNLGDGGTPTRFMIACACLAAEPVVVDGSKRMRERPIAEGVEMLRRLGASIEYVEAEGRLPVRVTPSDKFVGGEIGIGQTQSSQFISALMLIAPWLMRGVRFVIESVPVSASYLQLTQNICHLWSNPKALGFEPNEFNWRFIDGSIPAVVELKPLDAPSTTMTIERDASSAAYWFVAAAIVSRARLGINGLRWPADQPDANVVRVLMHANLCDLTITWQDRVFHEYPTWIIERGRKTRKLKHDCSMFPDGSLALAALAATLKGKSCLTGLRTLRVKETDRIAALANELRKVGCSVDTGEDWIEITPPATKKGGTGVSPVSAPSGVGETLQRRRRNLPHWQLGGSTYFISFRVREGELSHNERRIVASACRHWHGQRMVLHLGVVMHDHVHLLITPLRSGTDAAGQPLYHSLSELLQSIKSFSAHEIQRLRNSSGPFWQEESYDRIMRDDEEYLEKWNYMLNNPAEAGLVKRGEEYEHFLRGGQGTGETPVPPFSDHIIIETYNDHRMAMAFAVLGLAAPNGKRLAIRNPACVAKSYPTFWNDFARLYQ